MPAQALKALDPGDTEMSVAATSRFLGVHNSTVLRFAALGRLTARRSAGRTVFQRADVAKLKQELDAVARPSPRA